MKRFLPRVLVSFLLLLTGNAFAFDPVLPMPRQAQVVNQTFTEICQIKPACEFISPTERTEERCALRARIQGYQKYCLDIRGCYGCRF